MAVTETITVLFTDLVGSTEISYAISPDAADELLRAHFSVLRRAIAGSGGVEVKGLGDGVMVVFRSTSAALSCAVAMQQAVHRDNVGARHQLGLRIGLSGGEATMESNDYYGDPVIEAARLCAHADAGQILATDAVRVMSGRRSPYLFEPLGALELKGLPEPVGVLDVRWEPLDEVAAENGVPLPARLTHVPLTGVVARETEAALLTDAYKRAAAGEGRAVVLVSGDAGVGKTTLVAEAARRAAEEGACVLLGRCQEDVSALILALRRGAATITWRMRPSTCFEPTSRSTAATSHRWSPRSVNDWGQFRHRRGRIPTPSATSSTGRWRAF